MGRTNDRLKLLLDEISMMKDDINIEHSTYLDSRGRMSKKVTIEYDIQEGPDNRSTLWCQK